MFGEPGICELGDTVIFKFKKREREKAVVTAIGYVGVEREREGERQREGKKCREVERSRERCCEGYCLYRC